MKLIPTFTPDNSSQTAPTDGQFWRYSSGTGLWEPLTLRAILGQYDVRTDLTATNGATVTLNYALGNAFTIDASALASGNAFTVAISNLPAGSVFSALTLILVTGINIPTVTWPTGVTAPTLQASKEHWYTLTTRNNGTTVRLFTAGAF